MKANLSQLQIDPDMKRRPRRLVGIIFLSVAAALGVALYLSWPKAGDEQRVFGEDPYAKKTQATPKRTETANASAGAAVVEKAPAEARSAKAGENKEGGPLLVVSGYIVARERIEVSPRFQGVVDWIGVRKGDAVKKGQVVVRLDDAEYRAKLRETEGRLAMAKVALERAEIAYRRAHGLYVDKVGTQEADDEARLAVASVQAQLREIEGVLALNQTYLDWTVIKSPIDGVVLEKLVEPGELVVPMSFGGARGPSTALIAVADLNDLQVEIDLNEADLAKISLGHSCRVSPEAYPDVHYEGVVAEIAPEANRQKGTLQIKVGIKKPDRRLTPELTAKVEFTKQR